MMDKDPMSMESRIAIARLDERLNALSDKIDASNRDSDRAITLASDELGRRLETLNHDLAQRKEMLTHTVNIDKFEGLEKRTTERLTAIEREQSEWKGKLWLPMLIVAGLASAMAVAMARLLYP